MSGEAGCKVAGPEPNNKKPDEPKPVEVGLSAKARIIGAMRCGRIQWMKANLAVSKATKVTTIAGSGRRISTPVVTPSAKAKAA